VGPCIDESSASGNHSGISWHWRSERGKERENMIVAGLELPEGTKSGVLEGEYDKTKRSVEEKKGINR